MADALASLEHLVDFVYSGITNKITLEKSRLAALSSRIEVAQVRTHLHPPFTLPYPSPSPIILLTSYTNPLRPLAHRPVVLSFPHPILIFSSPHSLFKIKTQKLVGSNNAITVFSSAKYPIMHI